MRPKRDVSQAWWRGLAARLSCGGRLPALLVAAAGLLAAPARGEGIVQVLERSQQMQLDALRASAIDEADPQARRIRATYDAVLGRLTMDPNVPLIIVRAPLVAVCLMGRVIVVNDMLADLTESERAFILAHELGHVAHNHWSQLGDLYLRHIPGEVMKEHTDTIASSLMRDASELTHQQEYEADAFALRLLRRMGAPDDTPIVLFQQHLPRVKTTATHPGTAQRVAHLRELQ